MDGTFHAIATILHRVPREASPRGKRAPRPDDRDPGLRDIVTDGWIRVAL